jgi:hypothetical protein
VTAAASVGLVKVSVALLAGFCLLTTLPLSGCYGNVEYYAEKAAKHSCKRQRECQQADFERQWDGDLARCRDESAEFLLDADDVATDLGCEYVPEEARECVAVIRSARKDCTPEANDDIADACDRIYDCPGILGRDGEVVTPGPRLSGDVNASFDADEIDRAGSNE